MKSFATEVRIKAAPAQVWRILTDLAKWTEWNTTIERTQGTIEPGGKVMVWVKQNPGRAFPLSVTELEAPRRMVWSGGMPLGLFRGTRRYEISPAGPDETLFQMREDYTGVLAGLITRSIPDLQPAFVEFARCLKAAAER